MKTGVMLAAFAAVLVGCAPRPPVAVDSSDVEKQLYWSRALDHKRVVLEGYINFNTAAPNGGIAMAGGPQLRTQPYGAGEELLMITADFGTGPNQVSEPGMTTRPMFNGAPKGAPEVVTFDPTALVWRDAKGESHPFNHRVRVVGEVRYAVSIENDSRSPTGQRFRPFLARVTLEDPDAS